MEMESTAVRGTTWFTVWALSTTCGVFQSWGGNLTMSVELSDQRTNVPRCSALHYIWIGIHGCGHFTHRSWRRPRYDTGPLRLLYALRMYGLRRRCSVAYCIPSLFVWGLPYIQHIVHAPWHQKRDEFITERDTAGSRPLLRSPSRG